MYLYSHANGWFQKISIPYHGRLFGIPRVHQQIIIFLLILVFCTRQCKVNVDCICWTAVKRKLIFTVFINFYSRMSGVIIKYLYRGSLLTCAFHLYHSILSLVTFAAIFRLLTQCSWALFCDEPKNGCEGDYAKFASLSFQIIHIQNVCNESLECNIFPLSLLPGIKSIPTYLGVLGCTTPPPMVWWGQVWYFYALGCVFGAKLWFWMVLVQLERATKTRVCGVYEEELSANLWIYRFCTNV